jgi:hypothetical protein
MFIFTVVILFIISLMFKRVYKRIFKLESQIDKLERKLKHLSNGLPLSDIDKIDEIELLCKTGNKKAALEIAKTLTENTLVLPTDLHS